MSESLDLVVIVRYYGPKAQDFYKGSRIAMDILREDLFTLKLPRPKKEKTLIRSLPAGKGECSFMWPEVPARSILHRNLTAGIYGRDTHEARRRLLKELSICRLSLRESPGGTVWLDSKIPAWRTWGGPQAEAQTLLDNMSLALRVPKSESNEPTLPNSPQTARARDSVALSIPSPTAAISISFKDMPNPYANRQFDRPMMLMRPIKMLPESPVILSPSIHDESFDQMPPGLTFSARSSSSQITNNTICFPATSRKRSRSSSADDYRPRRPPPEQSHQSNANEDTSSPIDSLVCELETVRGQISGKLGHEAAIISQLDALGHSVSLRETPQEIALREKLQALDSQLEAETRMRIEAENALKDFQRECREPFLVPALYDVVESISRLTTQVVGRIQQEAGDVVG